MEIDLESAQFSNNALGTESNNHSSLISASGEGDFETVKRLLDSFVPTLGDLGEFPNLCYEEHLVDSVSLKVYLNDFDDKGQTALMKVSRNGCFKIVELLIKYGASSILKDDGGQTALMLASTHGNIKIVEYLLETLLPVDLKASSVRVVDEKNDNGDTALSLACFNEHADIVEFLICVGANMDVQNNRGETALVRACKLNNLEIVKLLKDGGANVYIKSFGQMAIWYVDEKETEIVRTLCDKLGKTEEAESMCTSELYSACSAGNVELVEFLLPLSKVNGTDETGWTPMHYAAYHNRPAVVKILLETNQICSPCKGLTPLMWAARKRNIDAVVLLADSESVCQSTEDCENAFLSACIGGNLDIVLYLVEKSDVRVTRCDGLTSLKVAFLSNRKDIVEAIAKHTRLTEEDLKDCYLYSESKEMHDFVLSKIN